MSAIPCPISIPKTSCPGDDYPILNISSEAPDQLLFVSGGWPNWDPFAPPPLGRGPSYPFSCFRLYYSYASQVEADLLARSGSLFCQLDHPYTVDETGNPPPPTIPPPPPPPLPPPPPPPPFGVFNDRQSVASTCPNYASSIFSVPAGTFAVVVPGDASANLISAAKTTANAQALAYVQQQAQSQRMCISSTKNPCLTHDFYDPVTHTKVCATQYDLCLGEDIGNPVWTASVPGALFGLTWTLTGNVAPGITLTDIGQGQALLQGSCNVPGIYDFTIQANANNGVLFSSANVRISVLAFTNTSPFPSQNLCFPVSIPLLGQGGTGPYTFSLEPSSAPLPGGLAIDNAVLHGSPTAMGTFNFVLVITDSLGQQCTKPFSMVVGMPTTLPQFITASPLPKGHDTTPPVSYFQAIGVNGGCGPYTIQLIAGALPGGLYLTSGYLGYSISGYPNPGTGSPGGTDYNFTLKATDAAGQTVTQPYVLTIDQNAVQSSTCPTNPSIVTSGQAIPSVGADTDSLNSIASVNAFNQLRNAGCNNCNAHVATIPRVNGSTASPNPDGNTWDSACAQTVYVSGAGCNGTVNHTLNGHVNLYSAITNFRGDSYLPSGVYNFYASGYNPPTIPPLLFSLYF